MPQGYFLPPEHHAIPLAALHYRSHARHDEREARSGDPAESLMVDLQRDSVLTVTEETDVEAALDAMFRLGVRLLLVVRASAVVGVLSVQDARRQQRPLGAGEDSAVAAMRVADVMVPCPEVPAIDWQTLQRCCVSDLAEIFAGCGAQYLVVLEDETPRCSRVRGLIARERLELRPGLSWR